jgi:hypothetical protein
MSFFLLLMLGATSAVAQVRVDVRLEKTRYLAGEPIIVLVDVGNVGDAAVGYSFCDGKVRLEIVGVKRRVPPNIFGCFSGLGSGFGGCAIDHPPLLRPGQTTTFRYLLKDYDLRPGQYQLSVSGKAGVRWKYYPVYAPNVPSPAPPTHRETDPVPGAEFERKLPLTILTAAERELRAAFAPLISNADGTDPVQRVYTRAAIVESAPPFLESLIARFASENQFDTSAIDALGRIASTGSRTHLKNLLRSREARRWSIVLALARIGHRDDADFLASLLQDETIDQTSRGYAALGLGHIGGGRVVRHLERALDTVPPEVRPSVATALGNTRSRAAVPILIGMYGNNPSLSEVCGALRTLTHRNWCGDAVDDPAATRRQWLRWWNGNGTKATIFGPENCPADPVVPEVAPPQITVERSAPTVPPRIQSVVPAVVASNSVLAVKGYALGLENHYSVRVLFVRDNLERTGRISSSGRMVDRDADSEYQYMDVFVPTDLTPGPWQLVIDANGRRSAPVAVEIIEAAEPQLIGILPARVHPAQMVLLISKTPAQVDDLAELTDARGRQWRMATGVSSQGIGLLLPDEVADGEASIRVGRSVNGAERFSAPFRFLVTSGPLPLESSAVSLMTPVAPGQWTDLVKDADIEFEVRRVDRIEVQFQQGNVTEISRATGPDKVHVQVPRRLTPGQVSVRTRTWIEKTASEWSTAVTFTVPARPVAPTITEIEGGPFRNLVWWAGDDAPAVAAARRGEALVLRGHFPVGKAADLRVRLRGPRADLDLQSMDVDGGVRVGIPSSSASGDYRLIVEPKDRRTAPQAIATVRVM